MLVRKSGSKSHSKRESVSIELNKRKSISGVEFNSIPSSKQGAKSVPKLRSRFKNQIKS